LGESADNLDSKEILQPGISRRQFVLGASALIAASTAAGSLLTACGSSASSTASPSAAASAVAPQGNAVLQNFPGWLGAAEIQNFHKQFPDASITLNTNVPSSMAGYVQLIKNNPGAYDMTLADIPQMGAMKAAGVYQAPNWSLIPNIAKVDPFFRKAYPDAIPNDYGIYVIAYRKDMVKEPITSWADFWRLAATYKGQVVVQDLDRPTIGMALKYLGFSASTQDPGQLSQATDALIRLKPNLQAVTSVNVSTALAKGTIAMAQCGNYDVALAQASNKNVAFVVPKEGTTGYFEGFTPVKGSQHLDVANAFLNFHLEPKIYADFVNTTGSSWVESAAEPFIKASLAHSAALKPTQAALAQTEWLQFVGEAQALYTKAWENFKSA
jgi:spermidine/putrescine transport system substrate-binding protein